MSFRRTASDTGPPVIKAAAGEEPSASTNAPVEDADEQEWKEDLAVGSREILTVSKQLIEQLEQENGSLPMEGAWIQIDATDETKLVSFELTIGCKHRALFKDAFSPLLYILSYEAARSLNLKIPKHDFNRFEKVVLHLPGICSNYVPTGIEGFDATHFEGSCSYYLSNNLPLQALRLKAQ